MSKGVWSGGFHRVSGYLAGSGYGPRSQVLPRSLHPCSTFTTRRSRFTVPSLPSASFLRHLTASLSRLPVCAVSYLSFSSTSFIRSFSTHCILTTHSSRHPLPQISTFPSPLLHYLPHLFLTCRIAYLRLNQTEAAN